MESAYLLVVDQTRETAEKIKLLLQNSGTKVRILQACSAYELEHYLSEYRPFLVILSASINESQDEYVGLASQFEVPLALWADPANGQFLKDALSTGARAIIHAQQDGQLQQVVSDFLAQSLDDARSAEALRRLEESQSLHRLLLDKINVPVAYLHEGLHVESNRAYRDLLGFDQPSELQGVSILELVEATESDLKTALRNVHAGRTEESALHVTLRAHAGSHFEGLLLLAPVRFQKERCVQVILRETSQTAEPRVEPEAAGGADLLTQMQLREAFVQQLANYLDDIEQRAPCSAVFYLRPDGFANYQNTLGHLGADRFLADFAELVRHCLTDADLACRFSDENIALLVRRDTQDEIESLGQSLLEACAHRDPGQDRHALQTSCSIGMVVVDPAVTCPDQVLGQARDACTQASESGDCLVRHKPRLSMVASDGSDHSWNERLSLALDHSGFYSQQQAIVSLEGDADDLYESRTFLREEQGDIEQEEFLAAAEACQMGAEIDRALIPGLLQAFAEDTRAERHIVSISVNSLLDRGFPAWLEQQLAAHEARPSGLVLQVAADKVAANLPAASRLVEELQSLGCGFALSSFDNETSHLRLLGSLDIGLVKLRHELVEQLPGQASQIEMVRELVHAANSAGAEVLADRIHDANHLAILWQVGIKWVAGDFLHDKSLAASR